MHELGIAKDFWDIIKQSAEQNKLKKITKIVMVLGEASGIEEAFIRHSLLDHILPGTIGANAELVIEKLSLTAKCKKCGARITKDNVIGLSCPECKSQNIEIVSGKEIYVKNIEGE